MSSSSVIGGAYAAATGVSKGRRHCEERRNEAIQDGLPRSRFAAPRNGQKGLPQRRFVEAPELSAVQAVTFVAEKVERFDADPEMLADRPLVECVGLAGQLQFAMKRLVRHA